jgi:hypothetical protein
MTKKSEEVKKELSDLEVLQEELKKMRDELKSLKLSKPEYSDREIEEIDKARDEMLLDDDVGALHIDEKYKEAGYFYRIVDTTRAGRVAQHIKRGYEIVEDPSLKVGSGSVNSSNPLGSAVTVELGTNKACLGVLMRIPQDLYDRRQKAKARRNKESDVAMMQDMVNKSDFGTIEIGSDLYKK